MTCDKCNGKKRIPDVGCMTKVCPICNGTGLQAIVHDKHVIADKPKRIKRKLEPKAEQLIAASYCNVT